MKCGWVPSFAWISGSPSGLMLCALFFQPIYFTNLVHRRTDFLRYLEGLVPHVVVTGKFWAKFSSP